MVSRSKAEAAQLRRDEARATKNKETEGRRNLASASTSLYICHAFADLEVALGVCEYLQPLLLDRSFVEEARARGVERLATVPDRSYPAARAAVTVVVPPGADPGLHALVTGAGLKRHPTAGGNKLYFGLSDPEVIQAQVKAGGGTIAVAPLPANDQTVSLLSQSGAGAAETVQPEPWVQEGDAAPTALSQVEQYARECIPASDMDPTDVLAGLSDDDPSLLPPEMTAVSAVAEQPPVSDGTLVPSEPPEMGESGAGDALPAPVRGDQKPPATPSTESDQPVLAAAVLEAVKPPGSGGKEVWTNNLRRPIPSRPGVPGRPSTPLGPPTTPQAVEALLAEVASVSARGHAIEDGSSRANEPPVD